MRMVDHKRHHVDTRSGQLTILAELAALMNAFQMIILYEISMPDPATFELPTVIPAVWGASCCVVACTNCGVMLIATFINFSILDCSSNEGFEEDLDGTDSEMFDLSWPTRSQPSHGRRAPAAIPDRRRWCPPRGLEKLHKCSPTLVSSPTLALPHARDNAAAVNIRTREALQAQ